MRKSLTVLLLTTLLAGIAVLGTLLVQRQNIKENPALQAVKALGFSLYFPAPGKVTQKDSSIPGVQSMLIAVGPDQLRVKVLGEMDTAAAQKHVREERQRLDLLFYDRQAPYPGQLSNTLRCPERFQPANLQQKGRAMSLIGLYANDRLAYGGCSEDLLRFRTTQGYFHDSENNRLILLEYFADMSADDRGPTLLRSFELEPM